MSHKPQTILVKHDAFNDESSTITNAFRPETHEIAACVRDLCPNESSIYQTIYADKRIDTDCDAIDLAYCRDIELNKFLKIFNNTINQPLVRHDTTWVANDLNDPSRPWNAHSARLSTVEPTNERTAVVSTTHT